MNMVERQHNENRETQGWCEICETLPEEAPASPTFAPDSKQGGTKRKKKRKDTEIQTRDAGEIERGNAAWLQVLANAQRRMHTDKRPGGGGVHSQAMSLSVEGSTSSVPPSPQALEQRQQYRPGAQASERCDLKWQGKGGGGGGV